MKTIITIIITAIATFLAIQFYDEFQHEINLLNNRERVDIDRLQHNNNTIKMEDVSDGI